MPCRWAIPNTSAMARSTTSRLGSGGFPILFIVLYIKGLPFGEKKAGWVRRSCSGRFRSLPIPLRISGHPAVQIACTKSPIT